MVLHKFRSTIRSFPVLKGVFEGWEDCLVIIVLAVKAWEPIFEPIRTYKSSLCKRTRRGIMNTSWWGRLEMPAISEFNWETMTQIMWHSYGGWFLTPNLRSPPAIHMQTWINTSTPYTQVKIIKGNNVLKWLLFFVLYFISLFIWTDI